MQKLKSRIIHLWYKWKWINLKKKLQKEKYDKTIYKLVADFIRLKHQPQLNSFQQRSIVFQPSFDSVYDLLASLLVNQESWLESRIFNSKLKNNQSKIRLDIWMEQMDNSPWYQISFNNLICHISVALESMDSIERNSAIDSYYDRNISRYNEILKELTLIFGEYYYE